MNTEPIPVRVGDTIVVNGYLFVLTEMVARRDLPATVTFKQPIELVEVKA